jgi:biopolymer transport protein TolQ
MRYNASAYFSEKVKGFSMNKIFLGNALWQLIMLADPVSKLVLLTLLGMSITCWTIFFYKLILLRVKREQMRQAISAIKTIPDLHGLVNLATEISKTLPGYFLSQNLAFLKGLVQRREQDQSYVAVREWEGVQGYINQTFDELVLQEERYMPILYSSAGVATLIGLFGTVWGLIHAFVRIGEFQSADIATVAPGIAEALITTLAGLVVAIPAFLMFHYLTVQNRKLEYQLSVFADRYTWIIKQLFIQ